MRHTVRTAGATQWSASRTICMTRRGTLRLPTFRALLVRAAQGDSQQEQDLRFSDSRMAMGRTRLATRVTTLPRRADLYFAGNFYRKAIWAVISFCVGYYCANTVSLSFGALAINDVLAAAITVAFCEVVSRLYYSAPRVTLKLVFLNSFKIGVVAALIADAFKLAG